LIKISYSIFNKYTNFVQIPKDIERFEEAGVDYLHLDVMDGHFVPNIFLGHEAVKSFRTMTKMPFDVHLMVENPEKHIEDFANAGGDIISIHSEACTHLHSTIQKIKKIGKKASVALNPATPLSWLEYVLADIDMILIMTVNPGFYGQTFIRSMLPKIRRARQLIEENNPNIDIQVDGNINKKTAKWVVEAGANVLVLGNGLAGQKDIKKAVEEFKKLG
jgi:ribulose-phosphate 3-epimerase